MQTTGDVRVDTDRILEMAAILSGCMIGRSVVIPMAIAVSAVQRMIWIHGCVPDQRLAEAVLEALVDLRDQLIGRGVSRATLSDWSGYEIPVQRNGQIVALENGGAN